MGRRRNYPKDKEVEQEASQGKASKGKGRNSKGNRNSKGDKGYEKTPATNDVNWRISNIKLRTDAGNISWSFQTGDPIPFNVWAQGPSGFKYKLPGVIGRDEMVCPGGISVPSDEQSYTGATASPANIAANGLLTVMRSKTRVRNTYDAPDIEMVLLACAEVYAGIALAKRLYATNLMYSYMNRYLPDALFAAQHIDPAPLKADSYAYLARLNRIISIMNTIYIPDRMPLFQVITQRYSNYYLEGPSIKDQIYVATPVFLRQYNSVGGTDYSSALLPIFVTPHDANTPLDGRYAIKFGNTNATTDDLLNCLEYMVLALINDSDVPDITGDMQNAFGEGSRFLIPLLAPDTMATPVYDEEFLECFMNSRTHAPVKEWFESYNYTAQVGSNTPTKYAGIVYQIPTTNRIGMGNTFYHSTSPTYANWWGALKDTLINVHKDPSVDKTIMITRYADNLRTEVKVISTTTHAYAFVEAVGVMGIRYNYVTFDNNGAIVLNSFCSEVSADIANNLVPVFLVNLEPFHYRPICYVGARTSTGSVLVDFNGELDIVATISYRDLQEINRLDMLNMLGAFDNI